MATYFDENGKLVNDDIFNAALAAADKPTYTPTYDDQIASLYDKIANREKFSYDINADPLYDMYKDQYIRQGKLAMKDTMGKAAALTGGYGSSYGQQVGQQAYDAYLQDLSAVIPELYGQAYQKYRDEGDDMLNLYGLLGDQRDTEYGRYRDQLSDWESNRNYEKQRETEEYNRRTAEEQEAYNRRIAEEKEAYNRQLTADNQAYERQQQAYSNLYAIIKASGYVPTDDELAFVGMTREAADALRAEYIRSITPAETSSGGSGGRSGGSGGGYGGGGSGSGSGNGSSNGNGNGGSFADYEQQYQSQKFANDIWGISNNARYSGDASAPTIAEQTLYNSPTLNKLQSGLEKLKTEANVLEENKNRKNTVNNFGGGR